MASQSLLYLTIFAEFTESMTLNLAQRSFKVIHFGGNRPLGLLVAFTLSSTVSEILPAYIYFTVLNAIQCKMFSRLNRKIFQ